MESSKNEQRPSREESRHHRQSFDSRPRDPQTQQDSTTTNSRNRLHISNERHRDGQRSHEKRHRDRSRERVDHHRTRDHHHRSTDHHQKRDRSTDHHRKRDRSIERERGSDKKRDRSRDRSGDRKRHSYKSRDRSRDRKDHRKRDDGSRDGDSKDRNTRKEADFVAGEGSKSPTQLHKKQKLDTKDDSVVMIPVKNVNVESSVELAEMGEQSSEDLMMQMMGLSGFNSTKGKHVPGTEASAVNIKKKRVYRQYMNRKCGFDNPLDEAK